MATIRVVQTAEAMIYDGTNGDEVVAYLNNIVTLCPDYGYLSYIKVSDDGTSLTVSTPWQSCFATATVGEAMLFTPTRLVTGMTTPAIIPVDHSGFLVEP